MDFNNNLIGYQDQCMYGLPFEVDKRHVVKNFLDTPISNLPYPTVLEMANRIVHIWVKYKMDFGHIVSQSQPNGNATLQIEITKNPQAFFEFTIIKAPFMKLKNLFVQENSEFERFTEQCLDSVQNNFLSRSEIRDYFSQDFSLGRLVDLESKTFEKLCAAMVVNDPKELIKQNWRQIAGVLGYDTRTCLSFKSPKELLEAWMEVNPDATIASLKYELENIGLTEALKFIDSLKIKVFENYDDYGVPVCVYEIRESFKLEIKEASTKNPVQRQSKPATIKVESEKPETQNSNEINVVSRLEVIEPSAPAVRAAENKTPEKPKVQSNEAGTEKLSERKITHLKNDKNDKKKEKLAETAKVSNSVENSADLKPSDKVANDKEKRKIQPSQTATVNNIAIIEPKSVQNSQKRPAIVSKSTRFEFDCPNPNDAPQFYGNKWEESMKKSTEFMNTRLMKQTEKQPFFFFDLQKDFFDSASLLSKSKTNSTRDRNLDVIPFASTRVKLPSTEKNPNGYINASVVNIKTDQLKNVFVTEENRSLNDVEFDRVKRIVSKGIGRGDILTQAPTEETFEDFVQMMMNIKVTTIVNLSTASQGFDYWSDCKNKNIMYKDLNGFLDAKMSITPDQKDNDKLIVTINVGGKTLKTLTLWNGTRLLNGSEEWFDFVAKVYNDTLFHSGSTIIQSFDGTGIAGNFKLLLDVYRFVAPQKRLENNSQMYYPDPEKMIQQYRKDRIGLFNTNKDYQFCCEKTLEIFKKL